MKVLLTLLGAILCFGAIQAQTQKPSSTSTESLRVEKDMNSNPHVCIVGCKDGKHIYAHGEKGHKCGAACMKTMSKNRSMKAHVCTDACKDGKHIYAHGEKGHNCTAACKRSIGGTNTTSMPVKEHVCSSSCKEGSHTYVHGEKGHACTAACHPPKS